MLKIIERGKRIFYSSVLIEGGLCCYKMYVAYYDQWSKEEISEEQFKGKLILVHLVCRWHVAGAAEAVYEWSGSGANPGLRIEQAPKDAATRGSGGYSYGSKGSMEPPFTRSTSTIAELEKTAVNWPTISVADPGGGDPGVQMNPPFHRRP